MRIPAASIALTAFLLLGVAAGQTDDGGDFPNLSTVVEGGATSTAKPTETTGAATTSGGVDDNEFPTVTNGAGAVPTYPPPTVPPTVDAPFMQKSTLPEGTVFIGVGAGLGFLLACVVAWRGFLVWTVHRNIKRAGAGYVGLAPQGPQTATSAAAKKAVMMGTGLLDGSVGLLKKKSPFYNTKAPAGSTMSLTPLNAVEPKSRTPSGNALGAHMAPSKSSLFFSPTAGAAGGAGAGSGIPTANLGVKRNDGYLPSGYYAGGNQAGMGQQERASQQFSMADFEGRSQHGVEYGAPPMRRPGSRPDIIDTRRDSQLRLISTDGRRDSSYSPAPRLGAMQNQSAISLGTGGGSRAPSAYLEDLFSYPPEPQNEHR